LKNKIRPCIYDLFTAERFYADAQVDECVRFLKFNNNDDNHKDVDDNNNNDDNNDNNDATTTT